MNRTNSMAEDKEAFQKFFKAALEGGWGLLQHYLCQSTLRGRRQSGSGLGNVIGSLHRPGVPLDLYKSVQVGGNEKDEKKKICVKMVNPTEQALDQAKSELKREIAEKKAIKRTAPSQVAQSSKKRRIARTSPKKARKTTRTSQKKSQTNVFNK